MLALCIISNPSFDAATRTCRIVCAYAVTALKGIDPQYLRR